MKELANDKTVDLSEMTGTQDDQPVAWRPSLEYGEHSRLKRFMDQHRIRDHAQLLARSTEAPDWFWDHDHLRAHQPLPAVHA